MEVLTAWLILKRDLAGASFAVVKTALCELAKAEHRLLGMRAMVDEADHLSEDHEFSADAEIDHNVLHERMRMCFSVFSMTVLIRWNINANWLKNQCFA